MTDNNSERRGAEVDSKFRYVLVVARRAEQLLRGARPRVEAGTHKPTRLASQEIDRGLVSWGYGAEGSGDLGPGHDTENVLH